MSTAASTGGADQSTGSASTGGSTGAFMWGDGWRNQLAVGSTDSEKELKQLERYESPEQIWRKARELERRMSSGEFRTTLRKDATTQEVTQWRKDNGVPEKAEDYKITMPAGKTPPKDDDAFLAAFRKDAHEANYTQAQFDRAVGTFYGEVARQIEATTEAEKKLEQAAEDKLRQEWGSDYRVNKAMAEALLSRAPQGFRDRFMNGYLDDHTPIKASPEAWKWLVQMEREINPAATVVPGAGGDLGKTIDAELTQLRTLMADGNSTYWKGPEAEKNQARYRDLLTAQNKMKGRAA